MNNFKNHENDNFMNLMYIFLKTKRNFLQNLGNEFVIKSLFKKKMDFKDIKILNEIVWVGPANTFSFKIR